MLAAAKTAGDPEAEALRCAAIRCYLAVALQLRLHRRRVLRHLYVCVVLLSPYLFGLTHLFRCASSWQVIWLYLYLCNIACIHSLLSVSLPFVCVCVYIYIYV